VHVRVLQRQALSDKSLELLARARVGGKP
jgi:hypothetical protein